MNPDEVMTQISSAVMNPDEVMTQISSAVMNPDLSKVQSL